MRKFNFQNGQFYHIFNRGVDKRVIFNSSEDYIRFLQGMKAFNDEQPVGSLWLVNKRKEKLVSALVPHQVGEGLKRSPKPLTDIICYSLLPNHFHLILQQKKDAGVSNFLQRLGSGYTSYFNQKNERSGSLFQGTYKAVQVESDEQLLYLSSYINGNPEIHKIAKADKYNWSSYSDYLGLTNYGLCSKKGILKEYKTTEDYREYTAEVIKESGARKEELKKIKFE